MDNQLIVILFLVLALSQITSLLYFYLFDRKMRYEMEKFLGTGSFDETKRKSFDLLHGAMKKSQALLVESELEGIKHLAQSDLQTEKLEQRYAAEVALTAEEVQRAFLSEVAKMSEELKKHLKGLEQYATESQREQKEVTKEQIEKLYLGFEADLRGAINAMNKQSLQVTQAELEAAKKQIKSYQDKRLAQLDTEIISVVSDVLKEVINSQVDSKMDKELIFDALKKAKAAHLLTVETKE